MATWSDFAAATPPLASTVRSLLCQYGAGLGYLATVRADGWPRVHPVSPVITDGGLFCFILNSAKRHDLERNGRYALHSCPPECSDDEACISGTATPVIDRIRTMRIARIARAAPAVDWRLFELGIQQVLVVQRPTCGVATTAASPISTQIWRE